MAAALKQNAQHKLDELKRGYRPEEIASAEARFHQTQATLEKFEHGSRPEDIAAARAALAYDEARFREREVVSPSAATVELSPASSPPWPPQTPPPSPRKTSSAASAISPR